MDPFTPAYSFQNLLNSQQPLNPYSSVSGERPTIELSASDDSVFGSQCAEADKEEAESVANPIARPKWSPTEDVVLISAWLNTSKDPVVGNEQKAVAFWRRIAAYFAASPKLAGCPKRERNKCKARWGKINEGVCKFVGAYEAATKQRSSGQNEDDVMKMAHEIYYNDYKVKFTLEHAWLELRHDQKWCAASATKDKVHSKRKRLGDDPAQSSTFAAGENEEMGRPMGVKAAKARGKKVASKLPTLEEEGAEFQSLWEIKQKDFSFKDKLNKQKLLEGLIAKTEPLTELEIAFKNQLLTEMLSI